MQLRKLLPLGNISLASAGLAALAMLALVTPATAGDINFKGWYGNLDLAMTQPNSLDQNFASHTNFNKNPIETERLVMDNDADLTWRLDIGYSWGTKGKLQVSYWQFDNDDNESGKKFGELNPNIVGYSAYYGQYLYDNNTGVKFEAGSSEKATTWDVDYIRPIASGDKFTVNWMAGLRVASYEETQEFRGQETYYGDIYRQEKHWKSDATGFRVGVTTEFAFTKMFSIEGSAAFSFLQADTSGTAKLSDDAGNFNNGEKITADDNNIKGEIRDFGVKAVWDVGAVDVYVGYSASNWDGMVVDPITTGVAVPNAVNQRARDNISFTSWNVGARWQVGHGKKK